ncbi:NAD-dependent epimerase/dehydratase family protein [Halarchaeum nitratireducens]|uniref:NDP-sugar dehydratase or epimerase n=1 Tax=Halarchaeum nitratireducens TaxID=489913 RepID=A0A830GCC7_9EURY|nr:MULTISPECIES: NAD-dependent epimerase/dehydratase family protein [Halarchaeum]MBP2252071.1 UDP-glucose 4-epimerase [Halarchaeum solikamskense]GGN16725.1 NDP-sugar dehydratase or epimerase [Halarchaeum nitratireducens]
MARLSEATALVTGGAGFVGGHLAHALGERGATVRVLDDCSTGTRERVPADATFVEGDVRDDAAVREAMAGVDVVFHEAAIVSVERSVEDPEATHAVNVDATLGVLDAAREVGARVVFASSAAIYGAPETTPVPEDAAKEPSSPYGLEKLSADHYCRLYADLYGVETVALRYFNVYGPGQRGGPYSGVITTFAEQARAGGPITVQGDGTQTRDFVHVSDVVRANLAAATTDETGAAYNVGTGRAVEIRELAALIRDRVAPEAEVVNGDARPGDIRASVADVSKARAELGFEAETALADGLDALLG